MDITKLVAKARLTFHLNMIDAVNVANQLHMMSDNKAEQANKRHVKECFDCYERLGVKLPEDIRRWKNEP